MRPRVYIETTIPSFYHTARKSADAVARRDWTRRWWETRAAQYELVTSDAVLEELRRSKIAEMRGKRLHMVESLQLLDDGPDIRAVVQVYLDRFVMPSDAFGDARHLAFASFHRCHFLLTWNCDHLANANKFEHIHHVNALLNLPTPVIVTPYELLSAKP